MAGPLREDATPGGQIAQAGEVRLARVESLRALAALAVLLGHLWGGVHLYRPEPTYGTYARRLLIAGGAGVWVFFALTGYLLFSPWVRRHFAGGEAIDLRGYARNRALRVLPLYLVAVVVLMVLRQDGGTLTLWWRHLLFVQSLGRDSLNALDGPLWSVAVEVQFYALLPLLAAGVAWLSRRRKSWAAALLLTAGLVSALARGRLGTDPGATWAYQLPTTFLFFVTGMVLALLRQEMEDRAACGDTLRLGRSSAWALASVPAWALFVGHIDQDYWCALGSFLLVGSLVLPLPEGAFARALDWRPLALLGIASYSLYVWHEPIVEWLHAGRALLPASFAAVVVVMGALCIAVAAASYRLVEAPGLRLRRRWVGRVALPPDRDAEVELLRRKRRYTRSR